jgi:hypothetical protein
MHSGSLTNPNTGAAKVYAVLSASPGVWFSSWDLTIAAKVSAVGTRVSEIRHQLPPGQVIEVEQRTTDGKRGWWYRLTFKGQLTLTGVMEWSEGVGR